MTPKLIRHRNIAFIFFCIASCTSDNSTYDLSYPKYYDKYSLQILTDTLFADTLVFGPEEDEGINQKKWYTEKISELVSDLKSDWQKPDSLFPLSSFDRIRISSSPWEFAKTLTNVQANRLLTIINDPVAFDWSETTFETEYIFEFSKHGHVFNTLELGSDISVFKPSPSWPTYKKMKFGHLTDNARQDIRTLIHELTK